MFTTPPRVHIAIAVLSCTGALPIKTKGIGGTQAGAITGTHGLGIGGTKHTPRDGTFTIGKVLFMLVKGPVGPKTQYIGSIARGKGAGPILHIVTPPRDPPQAIFIYFYYL
jgi:hypothetical protein